MMKKVVKVIGWILVILIVLLFCGTLFVSHKMVNGILQPECKTRDMEWNWNFMLENAPKAKPWADSLVQTKNLRDTTIVAPDGVLLHAYYVNAAKPTGKTAILVHGYTANSFRMMMLGQIYNENLGFNILLPDLRYHGKSEGEFVQMGWKDRLDVMQWIEVAREMYGEDTQIVAHGVSMGAATVMMLSGENLPAYVKCFVEDCGYTSVWDEFYGGMQQQMKSLTPIMLSIASFVCKVEHGWGFKEASSLRQVAKCKLPMLFIHGEKDDFVPTAMVYPLYEAKPEPKELWIAPEASHARSYHFQTETYIQKVCDFVGKYIH